MSLTGKLSPLGTNALSSLLTGQGFNINPTTAGYMGSSSSYTNYVPGTVTETTVLNKLIGSSASPGILAIAQSLYSTSAISESVYRNLLSMGYNSIPAFGNTPTSDYSAIPATDVSSNWATKWQYGFIRLIALQARNSFYLNNGSYSDFVSSFSQCMAYKAQTNKTISTLTNSSSYLSGAYSNMNDLTTSDITGVNIATLYWGQDLVATGRAIDLSKIDTFGNPADLLLTLQTNNALTKAVSLALLVSGLTAAELGRILGKIDIATQEQQRKIYGAFSIIQDGDLKDVLTPINCQTPGLKTLADLLDPRKLFPNSYISLTVPVYNPVPLPTNSKTYFLIYTQDGVNLQLDGYGSELYNVIPKELAIACGALRTSMLQIKNIKTMKIEKFSQVVTNLETTSGLAVNGTSTPVNTSSLTTALNALGTGSGPNNTYTASDFFGAMSGLYYNFNSIQNLIKQLQTANLATLYNNLYTYISTPANAPYSGLTAQINSINAEILLIKNTKPTQASTLNSAWSSICNSLKIEQAARQLALPNLTELSSSAIDIVSFVEALSTYALDTDPYQTSQVLEAIASGAPSTNLATGSSTPANNNAPGAQGGQSLAGAMREIRNANRIGLAGGVLDNDIPDVSPVPPQNRLGINRITGAPNVPGSLAGSPDKNLIPDNLSIFNITGVLASSVVKPSDAVQEVTTCNCDCWDILAP